MSAPQGWNRANRELKISTEATIIPAPLSTNGKQLISATPLQNTYKKLNPCLTEIGESFISDFTGVWFHPKNTNLYLCFVDDLEIHARGWAEVLDSVLEMGRIL